MLPQAYVGYRVSECFVSLPIPFELLSLTPAAVGAEEATIRRGATVQSGIELWMEEVFDNCSSRLGIRSDKEGCLRTIFENGSGFLDARIVFLRPPWTV